MASVSVLSGLRFDLRKLEAPLARVGYRKADEGSGYVIEREGHRVDVEDATARIPDLSAISIDMAREMLGRNPRFRAICAYEETDPLAWEMVLQFAQAVARRVPLAVLDDHAGTTYLVHLDDGLVSPEVYHAARRPNPMSDLLRRILGGDP